MTLCAHRDFDYKHACFSAYNRWLREYCAVAPDRLFGMAQLAMRSVADGIKELETAKDMGFRGVMMPGEPRHEDTIIATTIPSMRPRWRSACRFPSIS
jgi:predicted TIM-barrel fold metal-dependent hydrolase